MDVTLSNYQLYLENSVPVEDLHFEPLDKTYQRAFMIVVSLIYLGLMALALLLMLFEIPWILAGVEGTLLLACVINLSILPKAFRFKGYAFREHDISYRRGIIFPKTTTIPYDRIQQVSLNQNPVTKYFHLYSVEVVNGAQSLSNLTIPGMTEERALQIKNLVIAKIPDNHE